LDIIAAAKDSEYLRTVMKRCPRNTILSAALALLAALAVALPAAAACMDADCCLEAALEGSCPGCASIDCDGESPEPVTLGPIAIPEPPAGLVQVLIPEHSTLLRPASSDPTPSVYACLETTVLLI
jgi:hypothetical protein